MNGTWHLYLTPRVRQSSSISGISNAYLRQGTRLGVPSNAGSHINRRLDGIATWCHVVLRGGLEAVWFPLIEEGAAPG